MPLVRVDVNCSDVIKGAKLLNTMKTEPKLYHKFWTTFNVELYKKVLKAKRKQNDLKEHLKVFVI